MKKTNHLLSLLLAGISFLACATLRLPNSDPTPPSVGLGVVYGNTRINITQNTTLTISRNDTIFLTADGRDADGGVQNAIVRGDLTITCVDDLTQTGFNQNLNFLKDNPDNSQPQPGDEVKETRLAQLRIDLSQQQCRSTSPGIPSGRLRLTGISGAFTAEARNFYGSVVQSPTVRIEYPH